MTSNASPLNPGGGGGGVETIGMTKFTEVLDVVLSSHSVEKAATALGHGTVAV